MDILVILSVGLHLVGAAILIGGLFFFGRVLIRQEQRHEPINDALKSSISKRWLHIAWNMLLVMLVTGVFQVLLLLDDWRASEVNLPHMILGAKVLVFLGIVVMTILITVSRGNRAAKRPKYMAINLVLGIIILFLSALLARSY